MRTIMFTFGVVVLFVPMLSSFAQTTGWFYEVQNGTLTPVQLTVPPDDLSQVLTWSSNQASQIPVYMAWVNLPTDGQYDYVDPTDLTNEFNSAEQVWSNASGFGFSSQSQSGGSVVVTFQNNPDLFQPQPNGEVQGVTPIAAYNNKIVPAPPYGENSQTEWTSTTIIFNGTPYGSSTRNFYWTVNEYPDPNDGTYPYDYYMFFQNAAEHEIGHLVGMAHDPYSGNIMNPATVALNDFTPLSLGTQDQDALSLLWQTTPICNNCPPVPPSGFAVTVVGQNAVLTWSPYTDQTAYGLQVVKNGNPFGNPMSLSQTSYTDINAVGQLPATYAVYSFGQYGDSYSPSITLSAASLDISSLTTWSGTIYVTSPVTVNAGARLYISLGTNVVFDSGQNLSLTVDGLLSVDGESSSPVTFTSSSSTPSPGDWGSIVLNGSGANGSTIDYTDIDYGTDVQVNGPSNATIENSEISNNSGNGITLNSSSNFLAENNTITNSNIYHGIEITGGSNNDCYSNVIYKTNHDQEGAGILYSGSSGNISQNDVGYYNWGIAAICGASPSASIPNGQQRNNRVINSLFGLMVYYQSTAYFGTVPPPPYTDNFNSIYGNTDYNAAVSYNYPTVSSTLYADGNWWRNDTTSYYIGSSGYFSQNYPMTYDPWQNIAVPFAAHRASGSGASMSFSSLPASTPGNDTQSLPSAVGFPNSLLIGIDTRQRNEFKAAKDFFKLFIEEHPNNWAAYVDLYSCANDTTLPDIISFFKSPPPSTPPIEKLLLANLYQMEDQPSLAQLVNGAIVADYPNTPIAVKAEMDNMLIDLHANNDPLGAEALLATIETQASLVNPMELQDAKEELATYVDPKTGKMPFFGGNQKSGLSVQSYKSGLLQNYPNPFNPTTEIMFDMPRSGFVSLKVYDVLGREVETLTDEYKTAGIHIAQFNGNNLASGVYLYRLTAPGVSQVKKMLLIK